MVAVSPVYPATFTFEIVGASGSNTDEQKKERDKFLPRGDAFALVDKAGKKFRAVGVFPEYMLLYNDPDTAVDQMLNVGQDDSSPRNYIALFAIQKESSGFTLFIKNPARKEGHPCP